MALYQFGSENNLTGMLYRFPLYKSKEPLDSLLAHRRNRLTERCKRELLKASFGQGITADEGDFLRDLHPSSAQSAEASYSNEIVVAEDTSRTSPRRQ